MVRVGARAREVGLGLGLGSVAPAPCPLPPVPLPPVPCLLPAAHGARPTVQGPQPAQVVTYTLSGLAPIDAARLLARRVGRPLQELLPPAEPRGSLAAHALAALGGGGGEGGGGGGEGGGGGGGDGVTATR